MWGWLASPWTQVAAVPLVLLLVGVLARRLGRKDGDKSPRTNDWAVGTILLLMALGTILGDLTSGKATGVSYLPYWLLGVILAVFVSIDHDRSKSWVRDHQGLPTDHKRLFVGILVPDVACLAVFAAYQAHKVDLL